MELQRGLIGFFDVLGYQSLLENNEPEDVAESVISILTDIDKKVPAMFESIFNEKFSGLKLKPSQKTELKNVQKALSGLMQKAIKRYMSRQGL